MQEYNNPEYFFENFKGCAEAVAAAVIRSATQIIKSKK
jgi:hypothetical protein